MRTASFLLICTCALLLAGCTTQQEPPTTITSEEDQQATTLICPETSCPFGITFQEPFVKQEHFTIRPILSVINAEDCEQALDELRNTTAKLCRVQRAEMIRSAGRIDGKDVWQWRIDCACSYQP